MAILKHIASKNANYGSAIDYLKYQHDEFHLVPVLDERGNMLLREEFYPFSYFSRIIFPVSTG